jgi:hypothetical protein
MTFNEYYTTSIQKSRFGKAVREVTESIDLAKKNGTKALFSGYHQEATEIDEKTIQQAVEQRVNRDMDSHSCSEALDCLLSFYEVCASWPPLLALANTHRWLSNSSPTMSRRR